MANINQVIDAVVAKHNDSIVCAVEKFLLREEFTGTLQGLGCHVSDQLVRSTLREAMLQHLPGAVKRALKHTLEKLVSDPKTSEEFYQRRLFEAQNIEDLAFQLRRDLGAFVSQMHYDETDSATLASEAIKNADEVCTWIDGELDAIVPLCSPAHKAPEPKLAIRPPAVPETHPAPARKMTWDEFVDSTLQQFAELTKFDPTNERHLDLGRIAHTEVCLKLAGQLDSLLRSFAIKTPAREEQMKQSFTSAIKLWVANNR